MCLMPGYRLQATGDGLRAAATGSGSGRRGYGATGCGTRANGQWRADGFNYQTPDFRLGPGLRQLASGVGGLWPMHEPQRQAEAE
jgi:hypothetical protein